MAIIAGTGKRKKNLKTQRKPVDGYWFHNSWPKDVQFNMERSDNFIRPMDERFKPLATGLGNYYGEHSDRVERLARALFADVYHNPAPTLGVIMDHPDVLRQYGADLFGVMDAIGNYNIFFDGSGTAGEEIIEASDEIDSDLYMTKRKVGMPVKHFLLYLKGAELGDYAVGVMAGIPAKLVGWAYNVLTAYMWEAVNGIHRRRARENLVNIEPQPTKEQIVPGSSSDPDLMLRLVIAASDIKENNQVKFDQVEFKPDDPSDPDSE